MGKGLEDGGDLEGWRESIRGRADRILADLAGNIGFLQFFPYVM